MNSGHQDIEGNEKINKCKASRSSLYYTMLSNDILILLVAVANIKKLQKMACTLPEYQEFFSFKGSEKELRSFFFQRL